MSAADPILVVGGGIGGLAAARALSITGRKVTVCEQAPEFSEIGAGIQMGPNALRMLNYLGLRERVEDLLVLPDALVVMDAITATEVTSIPVGGFPERFGQPYSLVHRADLHRVLLDACEADPNVDLRAGATVTSYAESADGVTALTAAGDEIKAGVLIGADGLWSATRQAIVGDGAPRVSGHIAYRAVLPIEAVEERYRQNAMMLWAGPRFHLVQYPLRGGKLFNLVAVFHSDRYVEGWDRQGDPDELHRRFASGCDTVRELLAKVETWRMWVLCDREPVKEWTKGRVALLGDAAHPMLQYLAQGAGTALEDAVVLARELHANGSDHQAALRSYVSKRYLRTARCQILARVYGAFYHAEGVAAELRDEFLSARTPEAGRESLAWLYAYDPGPLPTAHGQG